MPSSMRAVDGVTGLPTILLALIIVAMLGAGIMNVIFAIMFTVWARFARRIRAEALSLKERDFVTMPIVAGVSMRVMAPHLP